MNWGRKGRFDHPNHQVPKRSGSLGSEPYRNQQPITHTGAGEVGVVTGEHHKMGKVGGAPKRCRLLSVIAR